MRILGIDPGSNVTGYGVVERGPGGIVHVAHGTIRTTARRPLEERLATILGEVGVAVAEYAPDRAVVERVFLSQNVRSALVLGQARGAVLAALGSAGIPVDELTPREVKKAVTGAGGAEKFQVQDMVKRLLGLPEVPPEDAADALAAAICRAQIGRFAGLDRSSPSRRRSARRSLHPGPSRRRSSARKDLPESSP